MKKRYDTNKPGRPLEPLSVWSAERFAEARSRRSEIIIVL